MFWLLLNVSLAMVFAALWIGVPVWLVLRRPDRGPRPQVVPGPAEAAETVEREPALVP